MRVVMFYQSVLSDWENETAHFTRGLATELISRSHEVRVYEPAESPCPARMMRHHGPQSIAEFHDAYPGLTVRPYDLTRFDLIDAVASADLVVVQDWNSPDLVRMIGEYRGQAGKYRLLFHDTHHRRLARPGITPMDLTNFDGVLCLGNLLRDLYVAKGWRDVAWTWRSSVDTRLFVPTASGEFDGDLVCVGDWAAPEQSDDLEEYLLRPARNLGIRAAVYGAGYPADIVSAMRQAGVDYRGHAPDYQLPRILSRYRLAAYIPHRSLVHSLTGVPSIRLLEAMACGLPVVSSPWDDSDGLFEPGHDYLPADDFDEMTRHIRALLTELPLSRRLALNARRAIHARHTCEHRANDLLGLAADLGLEVPEPYASADEIARHRRPG